MKTVCCVMLANGREAMVRRAVRSFQAQTYPGKVLFIWNTGDLIAGVHCPQSILQVDARRILPSGEWQESFNASTLTIGSLRNTVNRFTDAHWPTNKSAGEIIIHWDSDDWSHPNRIAEQVALLESSGKQCVGYRDMLFWDTTPGQFCGAWIWENRPVYCGSSMCYYREAWQRRPFDDAPKNNMATSEYERWRHDVPYLSVSSFPECPAGPSDAPWEPRMICSIHGANTMQYGSDIRTNPAWRRTPEWDDHARKIMTL